MFFSSAVKLCLAAGAAAALLLNCGCGDKQPQVIPAETQVISGEPSCDISGGEVSCTLHEGDELAVKYEIQTDPLTYYCVSAGEKGGCSVLLAGGDNDLNALSIAAEPDDKGSVTRVFRSDAEGSLSFQLRVSGKGSSVLSGVSYIPAEKAGYELHKSSSGNVRILLRSEDVRSSGADSAQLTKWLDALDTIRGTAAEWSADGLETVDICAVCDFDHYGLSGDPIYICSRYMEGELKKVSGTIDLPQEQQDILWGVVHEICHAADGFGHGEVPVSIFDTEFSAQLKCACCLDVNGYRYNGTQEPWEFFSEHDTFSNRLYSDEGFVFRLLDILKDRGSEPEELLPVFVKWSDHPEVTSASDGLEAFFADISDCVGYDITDLFEEYELEMIRLKYRSQDRNPADTVQFDD